MAERNLERATTIEMVSALALGGLGALGVILVHMEFVQGGVQTFLLALGLVGLAIGIQIWAGKAINRLSGIPYE